VKDLHNNLSITAAALADLAHEARNSKALKDLIAAAMRLRDYVRWGPEALKAQTAPTRAMDIGSLISGMREFKAVGPDVQKVKNLLTFFVRSMLRMRPDFDLELLQELPGLDLVSSGISPWPGLHDDWAQLKADSAFVKSELAARANSFGAAGMERLGALVTSVETAEAEATKDLSKAAKALEDLGCYFGVRGPGAAAASAIPRKDPPGLMVLCQLDVLLSGFRRACDEVREQQSQPAASPRSGDNIERKQSSDSVGRRPSLMELARTASSQQNSNN
jgi:hypothetical protein